MQGVSEEFANANERFEHDLMTKLRIEEENEDRENHEVEEEHEEEEEEEFTFVFTNSNGSTISADEAFQDGQIRPVFPVFNRDLLFSGDYDGASVLRSPIKKVFIQQEDNSPSSTAADASESGSESELAPAEAAYCEWTPKAAVKSNSTGFSKLWRFKDVKLRSNSDGKDTFVFLHHPPAAKAAEKARAEEVRNVTVRKVKGKTTSSSSAHEKHYVMYRAKKESEKHRSYLPYKADLFGFFANASGLSRNVHPY
ncbi:hypothetical protein RIF29_36273 [Crotalaria pallida]|uniref:Uncharacterized protein n=1 Tax=Crotalaria pallida TaxID=3830 RepID=A0AAN9EGI0_CROPI